MIGRVNMTNVFCHVIKISKNYQSKLIKMEEENDFENFEDNSIDPFNSSESEIDDSDSETEKRFENILEMHKM